MKSAAWVGVVLSLAGCGGDDEPCDMSHRNGTYLQHLQERAGGQCGQPPDLVVRLDANASLPAGCAFTADDMISADQCRFVRSIACEPNADGLAVATVGFTDEHDGGDRITGVFTITIRNARGATECVSTYDLEATRQ